MAPKTQPPGDSGDDRLSAYLDGELPDADRRTVEGDLAGSDARRDELQGLKDVSALLRAWDATVQDAHPSQQFSAFVASGGQEVSAELRQAAVDEEDIPVAEVVQRREPTPLWARMLLAVLAILAVVLVWHWLSR